jgi:hypothetical protein
MPALKLALVATCLRRDYVFAPPVLGAQAALSMTAAYGRMNAGIDATLTGPGGSVVSGSRDDTHWGFADLYPMGTLKWNFGVHNLIVYTMGDMPADAYDSSRLASRIAEAALTRGDGAQGRNRTLNASY